MDPQTVKLLSDWAQYLLTGAAGGLLAVWAALGRRDRGLAEQIAASREVCAAVITRVEVLESRRVDPARCAQQSERTAVLEARVAAFVTAEKLDQSIGRAHARMDQFESRIGRMEGLLEGIDRSVSRIEQHLLEHGPRARDGA